MTYYQLVDTCEELSQGVYSLNSRAQVMIATSGIPANAL